MTLELHKLYWMRANSHDEAIVVKVLGVSKDGKEAVVRPGRKWARIVKVESIVCEVAPKKSILARWSGR